jgi:hypothetical protein
MARLEAGHSQYIFAGMLFEIPLNSLRKYWPGVATLPRCFANNPFGVLCVRKTVDKIAPKVYY